MSEKLRIGVLGSGGGATFVGSSRGAYLGSLAEKTGLMDTVAVCDVAADRAEWGASRMRKATAYTDFDAFTRHGLDAVVVATPLYVHVEQSIALLERGIAVLCEVTPATNLVEAAQLAAAVERTRGFYMLAENYTFIDNVELLKRMADDGRFGHISFAEGEYIHDCRDLAFQADGTPTWRGQAPRRAGLYCTHSLGPILYITGDRIATVTCLASENGAEGSLTAMRSNTIMLMKSKAGRMFKVRLDTGSPRPHNMAYYSLQGDAGCYESWRGLGDEPKVWLADAHEPSRSKPREPGEVISQWHPLKDFAPQYIPDRMDAPEAARTSGHFGADYWMMTAFARALLDGKPSPRDVYTALDYCVPGIVAMDSRASGGAPIPAPDFRP